jgi:hypothetical protein
MQSVTKCLRCLKRQADEGSVYCKTCKSNFQLEDKLNKKPMVERENELRQRIDSLINRYKVENVCLTNDIDNTKSLLTQQMLRRDNNNKQIKELEGMR